MHKLLKTHHSLHRVELILKNMLQAMIMLRAEFAYSRESHSIVHWGTAIIFLVIGGFYGYLRFFKKLKDFELPGVSD